MSQRAQKDFPPQEKIQNRKKYSLLLSLTLRALLFIVCLSCALALLYVAGCYQLFLDDNIFDILRLLSVSAVVQIVFSGFIAVESIVYTIPFKQPGLLVYIPVAIVSAALGLILFIFSQGILFLSAGIPAV